MYYILKNRILKGVVTEENVPPATDRIERIGEQLNTAIIKQFGRSLHIRQVDTGSCGACESEIISMLNPIYDIQRYGINFVASPRHADALMVTGPLSKNMLIALKKTYAAMPQPNFVIAVGDCACDKGIFKDSYYVTEALSEIVPVALYIPGCPPSPLVIMDSLLGFLNKLK